MAACQAADARARCPTRASLRRRALASGWCRVHYVAVGRRQGRMRSSGARAARRAARQSRRRRPPGRSTRAAASRPRDSLLVQGAPRPGPCTHRRGRRRPDTPRGVDAARAGPSLTHRDGAPRAGRSGGARSARRRRPLHRASPGALVLLRHRRELTAGTRRARGRGPPTRRAAPRPALRRRRTRARRRRQRARVRARVHLLAFAPPPLLRSCRCAWRTRLRHAGRAGVRRVRRAAARARRRGKATRLVTFTAAVPGRRRVTACVQHAQCACGATPRRRLRFARMRSVRRKVSRGCKHLRPRRAAPRRARPAPRGVWQRGAHAAGVACAAACSRRSHRLTGFLAVAVPLLLARPPRRLPQS